MERNLDKVIERYMKEIKMVNEKVEFRKYMSAEEDNEKIKNSLIKEAKEEEIGEGLAKGSK